MTWQPDGTTGTLTLTILSHDCRVILVELADPMK